MEISQAGVSALQWRWRHGRLPLRLTRVSMAWGEVQTIARRGMVVSLSGPAGKITVNTYLFRDPNGVLALIDSNLAQTSRQ